jgi:peptide/nickel transport system substrate-binding protein
MSRIYHGISRRQALIGGACVAAGVGFAELLAACGNNPTASTGPHIDTLTIGTSSVDGPTTSDPLYTQQFATGYALLWTCSEQLYYRDTSGKLQPGLATDWKIASDNLTWTITTRTGVKMQDGSTFTANDVATSINRLLKYPKYNLTAFAAFVKNIATVKVLDDTHVQIVTNKPYPTLLIDAPAPIPTAYYNSVGDDKFSAQPLAAGPFKFVSLQPNQSYTYVRFDDYWDKTRFPNFKNLVFKVIPDESTRLAGLLSGDLDVIQGIGAQSAQQIAGSGGKARVIRNDNVGIGCIYLPGSVSEPNSPLQDVRVRQALLYAVDRASLAKTLFNNTATVLPVAIPQNAVGWDPKLKPYPFDVNKAKQLLAAAGLSSGFTITLNMQAADSVFPNIQNVAQAIAQNWQAIGVKTDLNPIESATMQQIRRAGKLKGGLLIGSLANSYYELAYIGPITFASTGPNHNMADPKLDAIVNRVAVATDATERARIGTEMTDYVYDNVNVIPLIGLPAYLGAGPKVKQLKPQLANPYLNPWFLQAT